MAATSRVDDLRKRYHENPRRFFAPLANEYRKTGFIDRAILLCEKHLGEQPGNMNGLVVYGQCLFETGRLDEARAPFEAALVVDPENLIALRHLGDIARLGEDHESARGWYRRVLEFDRRNDEVIALLHEVGGGEEPPPAPAPSIAPSIISVASSVSVASSAPSPGLVDLDAPTPGPGVPPRISAFGQTEAPPRAPAFESSAKTVEVSATPTLAKGGSLFDVDFDFGEAAETSALSPPSPAAAPPRTPATRAAAAPQAAHDLLDSIVVEAPSAPLPPLVVPPRTPQVDPPIGRIIDESDLREPDADMSAVDGLILPDFSSHVPRLAELEASEFEGGDANPLDGLESIESLVPPPEARHATPSLAMDHMSKDALVEVSSADLPLLPDFGEPEQPPNRSSAIAGLPLLPSLEEAETLRIDVDVLRRRFETPATFVTETMAALYVQQGLNDKAIDVYRQLIAQTPNDQGLKDRLSALERSQLPPVQPGVGAAAEPAAGAVDEFPEFDAESLAVTPPSPRTTAPRVTLDFETPVAGDLAVEPPAPANAMLSAMSFADVSLTTPLDTPRTSVVTPVAASLAPDRDETPVPDGPSAREFFSAFARRALTPLSMMVVSAVPSAAGGPMSPLDEIFGLSVSADDESSAHRLAAIGATSGPSGGTALDSVFGEGPSAPMPAEAPSSTPPRGSVPRASTKLRFDQFFASSVASATPSSEATVPEPEAASAPEPEPDTPTESEQEPPGDDDLDQFQGWLRRLTQ